MAAPQAVRKLVDRYEMERHEVRAESVAARARGRSVRELLKLLAWGTNHGRPHESEPGVIVSEHRLQTIASDERRPPQYSLFVGDTRKCFVEVSPHSPELGDDAAPAFQLRRFAWSANVPASILSNFEDLSIYSGRVRPRLGDPADAGLIHRFSYTEYEKHWP